MSMTNILVVDDNITVCWIVQRMLSDGQYQVQISQSVADALGAIEQEHFDVCVLDYRLPDGSGFDVAERIRSTWGATPIILITGYSRSVIELRAQKFGISDFLEKPFSWEIMNGAMKKAINSQPAVAQ
jgi:DNA-binding NtrC family response regulator